MVHFTIVQVQVAISKTCKRYFTIRWKMKGCKSTRVCRFEKSIFLEGSHTLTSNSKVETSEIETFFEIKNRNKYLKKIKEEDF